MRRILFVAAALVLACATSAVMARPLDAQLVRFGVGGGPSFPVGGFSDIADTGFHAQGRMSVHLPLLPIHFRGDLMYQQFGDPAGGNNRQVAGVVSGVFDILPLPIVRPYVTGGVGVYNTNFSDQPHPDFEDSTDFGANVGAGVRLGLLLLDVFLEARYHHVLGDNAARSVPITFGVTF